MSAIPITIFLSLALAFLFVFLFWRQHRNRPFGGAERESLLPLEDEIPRLARPAERAAGPKAPPHS